MPLINCNSVETGIRRKYANVPSSFNVPFKQCFTNILGNGFQCLRFKEELEEIFIQNGVDPDQPITAMSGDGMIFVLFKH